MGNRRRRRAAAPRIEVVDPGFTDPSTLGVAIAGPGDPHSIGEHVLDMSSSLIMESYEVSVVDKYARGKPAGLDIFMIIGGRVNKTTRRAKVGVLLGPDGVAAIVSELLAIGQRAGMDASVAVGGVSGGVVWTGPAGPGPVGGSKSTVPSRRRRDDAPRGAPATGHGR